MEFPRAPAWARPGGSFRENSEAEALFFAGAALSALNSVAKSSPPWAGVWRRRLALKSAAAVAQNLLKRREDEAALRDAIALGRPGQDLGPAGRVYAAFRILAGPGDPFRPKRLAAVAADLQAPLDPQKAAELAAALRETGGRGRPAPVVAAEAAAAVMGLRPNAEPLAIFCADAALARTLGWLCCKPCHRLSGWGVREEGDRAMSEFKGRHFEGEIVLWAVRWYCRYGVDYRDLEQMMGERPGLTTRRSIAGFRGTRPRSRNGCAGSGAGRARLAGASTRRT